MFQLNIHITSWYVPYGFFKPDGRVVDAKWKWAFSIGCITLTKFN